MPIKTPLSTDAEHAMPEDWRNQSGAIAIRRDESPIGASSLSFIHSTYKHSSALGRQWPSR